MEMNKKSSMKCSMYAKLPIWRRTTNVISISFDLFACIILKFSFNSTSHTNPLLRQTIVLSFERWHESLTKNSLSQCNVR